MNDFPHHIFREYDIRGIAYSDITQDFAYQLGKAFASMLPQNTLPITVARDARLSGEVLQQAIMQGLTDAGRDVLDIGMVPTPLAYFSVFKLHTAGCMIVTASHNPSEYNGFKLMMGKESLHGKDIQKLKALMQSDIGNTSKQGKISKKNIQPDYEHFVVQDCPLERPLKVVIDAGNGPSGVVAAPVYRQLGCEVIELYCQPDGNFPNHHPDPTVEDNLKDLAQKVCETKADLGIAFDGDGDRIGVVDEHGTMIWSDMLLLLLATELLKKYPKATIISEIKSSEHLYTGIRQAGGKAIMWRTGHSPIKAKMKETGALLAGEMSGHIFYADRFYGFDDAVYAGARLMQILAQYKQPISTLFDSMPKSVTTAEIRIPCPEEQKSNIVEKAKKHFQKQGYTIIDIDGMRIQFDDGWGLLRASNTQPALTLRFEASNSIQLEYIRNLLQAWLKQALGNL
jgi:phosphomannomutase/phosphoglucomutase